MANLTVHMMKLLKRSITCNWVNYLKLDDENKKEQIIE